MQTIAEAKKLKTTLPGLRRVKSSPADPADRAARVVMTGHPRLGVPTPELLSSPALTLSISHSPSLSLGEGDTFLLTTPGDGESAPVTQPSRVA
ncbi:hypothetical protein MTO96_047978 [Rhipicephalus appendiculatus]